MDVKSYFLNGYINEEVYVKPLGFEYFKNLSHLYKLRKVLDGLKQAPRAWYNRLSDFLIERGFIKANVDTTLSKKKDDNHTSLVQVHL